MKNLLVTGGAGFIGSNFVRYLLGNEPEVRIVNLDALTYAGSPENLRDLPDPERHQFIRGDINDRVLVDRLLRESAVDTIIHFAAETHVDRSIHHPEAFVRANVLGTFTLLEAVRVFWLVERAFPTADVLFHHVSTDEVFGSLSPSDPAFNETTPYDPRSPYSASKAASDHLVRAYHHTYGLPITITNCSNNYGPQQFPEKLIPLMLLNARSGRPLPVYGDGLQIRDWLYVDDHSEAIRRVIKSGRRGETYCIGGDNQPPNIEIVRTLCQILDELEPASPHSPHESLITHVADRPGHDRRYDIDIDKIRSELGWSPQESLASGLLKTVRWYIDHPEWVEAIRSSEDYAEWVERNYGKR
ncbi:MAG TPA: dTDP-glucose 4,6-dehydratase [Anaerolineales bacterium]|nr:dTDP-glucose 4,6-dehydratase [Anaerolineales bacterium]